MQFVFDFANQMVSKFQTNVLDGNAYTRGRALGYTTAYVTTIVLTTKSAINAESAATMRPSGQVSYLQSELDWATFQNNSLGSTAFASGMSSVDDFAGATNNLFGSYPSVSTPYGPAAQAYSQEALSLRQYVDSGGELYRGGTLGRSNTTDAQFWSTENPLSPGYANKYGVDFSQMDYVIKGTIKDNVNYITRPVPGLGNNVGGGIEIVTPPNSVNIEYFYMLGGK